MHEETLLREAVSGVAGGFGHEYYARINQAHENATELWDALAAGGYVGANIPEAYGGGGLGLTGLAAVIEEVAAAPDPRAELEQLVRAHAAFVLKRRELLTI